MGLNPDAVTVTVSLSAYDGVTFTVTVSLSAYDDESSNPYLYPQWVRIWRLLGASPVRERFERRLRTLRSVAKAMALLNLKSENIDCKEGSINLSCEHKVRRVADGLRGPWVIY